MINYIAFFIISALWIFLIFKVFNKSRYSVLWYPTTFGILIIMGSICGIA